MKYVRHHFIPQFILRNFSKENDSVGEAFINVYHNFTNEVETMKISNAYMVHNLYDSTQFDDIKQLEKDLGQYLESKVAPIIKRIFNSNKNFVMNRDELKLIKKYLLITIYRTETNMSYYIKENIKDKIELSDLSINEGESKLDFWKREMFTIIHNEWDFLCSPKCPIESVRHFTSEINQSHLCIFENDDEEFIINDIGRVSEMIPVQIPENEVENFKEAAEMVSKNYLCKAKEILEYELKNKTSKIETFMFFPISPKKAIVVAKKSNAVGIEIRHYEMSITLNQRRFSPPFNDYINKEVYSIKKEIQEYYRKNIRKIHYIYISNKLEQLNTLYNNEDKFIYPIQKLNNSEVILINCLMLNESKKHFSFLNSSRICKSIRAYNDMYRANTPNIKNNFLGSEVVIRKS
ncbi:DUF4238 domain-containing protein [Mycoplasmatota bacterium]|nr:DUF4238 domain-containing protein [Mycoplasmatota bacterium]